MPIESNMTPDDLNAFVDELGVSGAKAAAMIGIARGQLYAYRAGKKRIPAYVGMACAAAAAGLASYKAKK